MPSSSRYLTVSLLFQSKTIIILLQVSQFMVFRCHASCNSDMKQKEGGNYYSQESLYQINGQNNPQRLPRNRMGGTSSNVKISNCSKAAEQKK